MITLPFFLSWKWLVCFTFAFPNLHLHVVIVCFMISCASIDEVLPRSRIILMSGRKNFSFLMEWSTSSRAGHSELLVLVVQTIEPILEVQALQVHFEDMQQDTVIAKDSLQSDLVSVGNVPRRVLGECWRVSCSGHGKEFRRGQESTTIRRFLCTPRAAFFHCFNHLWVTVIEICFAIFFLENLRVANLISDSGYYRTSGKTNCLIECFCYRCMDMNVDVHGKSKQHSQ